MGRVIIVLGAALMALVVLPAACVGIWLVVSTEHGDRYVPTLDALQIPSTWEAVHTEVLDGGFIIHPRATRYYFIDTTRPEDSVAAARAIVESAGFEVQAQRSSSVACIDGYPATCTKEVQDHCSANNRGSLPRDCFVQGVRGLELGDERVEHLAIHLGNPGESFTVGTGEDRRNVSDPDRALVSITADMISREAFRSPAPVGPGDMP